jgi:sortase A
MRRAIGNALIVSGLAFAGWALLTDLWQEPISAVINRRQQTELNVQLHVRRTQLDAYRSARAYRLASHDGEAMGRIVIPRIGLNAVIVDGTSPSDLAKGPGIFAGDYVPGEGRLVYIAGHRTIYGAPFSHLDVLRRGDTIAIAMPYGSFTYRVTGHRIVKANELSVLRSHGREQLILQTCHPRFSASHRYLVYAEPIRLSPQDLALRRAASSVN